MPTYEYRCRSCGYEFEEFQSMSAEPLVICPQCAKPSLKRLVSSGAGLLFKGTGFYLTDYKKSNASGAPSNKRPEAKSDSKTESDHSADKTASTEKK
jgi:putative FmdB family regulatory protein